MADANTGKVDGTTGDGSKIPALINKADLSAEASAKADVLPEQIQEAHIIEETIIRPASKSAPPAEIPPAPQAPIPAAKIPPPPQVPAAPTPPPAVHPPQTPPAPVVQKKEAELPKTPLVPPEFKTQSPSRHLSSGELAAGSGVPHLASLMPDDLAKPIVKAPAIPAAVPPKAAPMSSSSNMPTPAVTPPDLRMSKILKEIKIPDRQGEPPKEKNVRTFDTTLGVVSENTAPIPPTAPTPTAPTPTLVPANEASKEKNPGALTALHTLKGDLQNIVRVNKMSYVRAAALEQDKPQRQKEYAPAPKHSGRTFAILFAAVLLLVLGAAAIFGVFLVEQQRGGEPTQQMSSILFSENAVPFPLEEQSPLELKRILGGTRTAGGAALGSITRIVPIINETNENGDTIPRVATTEEFFSRIGARTSPDLLRALTPEFFFGIHTVDENAPVVIVPVISYERAFAGMLAWEASMNADLTPVFTPVADQVQGPGGLPQKRQFEDIVMRNYDVRALKDDAGEIQLYYSFPTQNLLIIAESPYSFTEILSRLRAERRL